MKVEIRTKDPIPPKEVVVTMTVAEAREIHNAAYAAQIAHPDLRALADALTSAGVQLPAHS